MPAWLSKACAESNTGNQGAKGQKFVGNTSQLNYCRSFDPVCKEDPQQPWYRLPESSSENDNADIERYLGHASYNAVYKLTEDRTFSLKLLNNLRSDNRTSVEFGYSFPIGETLKGFFQYYNGYGESLIDYNERIERFGIGIMLNDWL